MPTPSASRYAVLAAALSLALVCGCKNKEQRALQQARTQAASTRTAQQIQYIDRNGDTVTLIVQPPVAGQPSLVGSIITPPAPGPAPHATDPVITPLAPAHR